MTRTFILHTPLGPDDLKFANMQGTEALSKVSDFTLQCLSLSDSIGSLALLGQSITVEIIQQDGSSRFINGIVTEFSYMGPESSAERRYRYELKMSSWLWLADKTSDSRIFQQMDVPAIIKEVLQGFGMPFEIKTMDDYFKRDYVVQYQETALNFVKRLAEEVGLYFYVRHDKDSHTIVFTDGSHNTLPVYDKIPFLTPSLRTLDAEEYVKEWRVRFAVKSGSYATTSYDYRAPNANLKQTDGAGKGHANDNLQVFEWSGAYTDRQDGAKRARVRSEQQQLDYQIITANSNVRGIAPGYYFTLTDHPGAANAEYLITSANYQFQENADSTGSHEQETSWDISFTAKPSSERYQPPHVTVKPSIIGPQPALVTGPAGQEIWVNDLGQIKVSFYWDRHSAQDENSSCWVRVASSWAGAYWGESMVPRIGQEVIIEHENGDPDRPIVVGRVNNANNKPPIFSKVGGLPVNHALAGIKSMELQGKRYNHLLFDDTHGEIRAQLESEHGASQLNLGYLSHPRVGSATPRGEGFELRSDLWGALRAANGLLLSADGQNNAGGNALSRDELSAILEQALSLAKNLGDFAAKNLGNTNDFQPQTVLSKAVKDLGHGSNVEKGDNGATPVVAVSAPAGIVLGTSKSATIATGEHIDLAAAKNQQISAGQQINLHATEGISQFAIKGDIKSIAHQGKNLVQSNTSDVQIVADKSVEITASEDHILVAAQKFVTLTSGGAYIKIADGNIEIHCPGTIDMKSGNYTLAGPASYNAKMPELPKAKPFDEQFILKDKHTGQPMPYVAYHIVTDEGETIHGMTDENGATERIMSAKAQGVKLFFD